jgi:endonuclease/exonuclease/phosphatase family metal-dependent hydrolase
MTATLVLLQPAKARPRRYIPLRRPERLLVSTIVAFVLLVPVVRLATVNDRGPLEAPALPLRVMTYNVHHGFDAHGDPSIDRIVRIIEEDRPDIVALQEVSRSWLVAGSFDMLEWLARRLDMHYVWGPTADGTWGNAILSRYPIAQARTFPMPNNDQLRLDRAFTRVDIEVGQGQITTVFATHLHASRGDTAIRLEQIRSIIAAGASDRSDDVIVLGDLNFRQWEPEHDLLQQAGFLDSFKVAGARASRREGGATSRANVRIDYIWVTPSLELSEFEIGSEFASDHLPIAVTVR